VHGNSLGKGIIQNTLRHLLSPYVIIKLKYPTAKTLRIKPKLFILSLLSYIPKGNITEHTALVTLLIL